MKKPEPWFSRKLFHAFLPLSLLLWLTIIVPAPLHAESPETDFWNRNWQALDLRDGQELLALPARERSLHANALWLQGRWKEAVVELEALQPFFPVVLTPYSKMLILLGLERTDRREEALTFGLSFFPEVPTELRFYAAYALARLSPPPEREKWYREMVSSAREDRQKSWAYEGLLALPGDRAADALALLKLRSLDGRALEVIGRIPEEIRSPEMVFALGYAAFLRGNFHGVLEELKDFPEDHDLHDRAAYYLGMAHYRLKEYDHAFSVWKDLVLQGKERYASAAVKRLAILAGTSFRDSVLGLLRETADGRTDRVGKGALFHLSRKEGEAEGGEGFIHRLLQAYPMSDEAAELLWDRGWTAWKGRRFEDALRAWEKGLETRVSDSRQAQLLYWAGRALGELDRPEEAKARFEELRHSHPRSYYFRLAFPGEDLPVDSGVPEELQMNPDLLETWGFVYYAILHYLDEGSQAASWRAARLAYWMGDSRSAYRHASRIQNSLPGGGSLSGPLMELLYPRPYREIVSEFARRFGTEENLAWAVMRQESGFDPEALSWVGATGLMQLMPATAEDEARRLGVNAGDLTDPEKNLLLGVSHLSRLLERFKRIDWAVAAYNAGSGSVGRWTKGDLKEVPPDEWIEDIPYDETRDYVKKVLANLYTYRQMYGQERRN